MIIDDINVLLNKGYLYLEEGNFEKAWDCFKEADHLGDNSIRLHRGQLLAAYGFRNTSELGMPLDTSEDIKKASKLLRDYEEKYSLGKRFYDADQYVEAIRAFEEVKEYKDAKEYIRKCHECMTLSMKLGMQADKYRAAIKTRNVQIYITIAITAFFIVALAVNWYVKDATDIYNNHLIKTGQEGTVIQYGTLDGKPVDWVILERNNNAGWIYVQSVDIIGEAPFTYGDEKPCWETSPVRYWLQDFYEKGFTDEEKEKILLSQPWIPYDLGRGTKDYLYILSYEGVEIYHKYPADKTAVDVHTKEKSRWWVMNREGYEPVPDHIWFIDSKGYKMGMSPYINCGIRPVMKIRTD